MVGFFAGWGWGWGGAGGGGKEYPPPNYWGGVCPTPCLPYPLPTPMSLVLLAKLQTVNSSDRQSWMFLAAAEGPKFWSSVVLLAKLQTCNWRRSIVLVVNGAFSETAEDRRCWPLIVFK